MKLCYVCVTETQLCANHMLQLRRFGKLLRFHRMSGPSSNDLRHLTERAKHAEEQIASLQRQLQSLQQQRGYATMPSSIDSQSTTIRPDPTFPAWRQPATNDSKTINVSNSLLGNKHQVPFIPQSGNLG